MKQKPHCRRTAPLVAGILFAALPTTAEPAANAATPVERTGPEPSTSQTSTSDPSAEAGSPIECAEQLLAKLAHKRPSPLPFSSQAIDTDEVEEAVRGLQRHLDTHPDDVEAAILLARLSLTASAHITFVDQALFGAAHAALDRLLALDPSNAELHYWKARLYGLQLPLVEGGAFQMRFADLEKALDSSRAALSLQPENLLYREALALYLVADDKRIEARDLMQQLPGEPHPIFLLLSDLEAMPVPEEAIPAKAEAGVVVQMMSGHLGDYPQLRVVSYYVPWTASTLEAFFADQIEGFSLFLQQSEELDEGTELRGYVQHLTDSVGGLRPAASPSEASEASESGLSLTVTEYVNVSPTTREMMKLRGAPQGLPDAFCHVLVTNLRAAQPSPP